MPRKGDSLAVSQALIKLSQAGEQVKKSYDSQRETEFGKELKNIIYNAVIDIRKLRKEHGIN